MRPKCKCGKIAGYWYAPIVYQRMSVESYFHHHAYCEDCADTEDWAEYWYIGFHKKDWRWLKKNDLPDRIEKHNERMKLPAWIASHVKEDGIRWHLGLYGGYHGFYGCKSIEDVIEATKEYKDVIIEEYKK